MAGTTYKICHYYFIYLYFRKTKKKNEKREKGNAASKVLKV